MTVGTTPPIATFWIPASSGLDMWIAPGYRDAGLVYTSAGLVVAATTTIGGSTNPTTGLLVNLSYL